jgi:predicted RNA-binding Zn-ribbon protein involved in translation (DUF1610 family)
MIRQACPRCGQHVIRRSHTRGMLERLLKAFRIRPYRCETCYHRFYRPRRLLLSAG